MPLLLLLILLPVAALTQDVDYLDYHHRIIRAEKAIVEREFETSLNIYRQLAETYEFVFLRDVKNAVQLSAYINDTTNLYFFSADRDEERVVDKSDKKNSRLQEVSS